MCLLNTQINKNLPNSQKIESHWPRVRGGVAASAEAGSQKPALQCEILDWILEQKKDVSGKLNETRKASVV